MNFGLRSRDAPFCKCGTVSVLQGARSEQPLRLIGAGLVPALGTHKGCPYVAIPS